MRPRHTRRIRLDGPSALRDYSLPSLALLFFLFSFAGWVWEVSIHLVRDGVFVDRGVLHGPWLPIYGIGGLLILVLLARFRSRPLAEFGAAVVLCGAVEYATSWYLETAYGLRWWDYTGYLLNLNGRICAEGLLTFGVFGLVIVYVVAPSLDDLIRRWRLGIVVPVCLVLLAAFAADGPGPSTTRTPDRGSPTTTAAQPSCRPPAPRTLSRSKVADLTGALASFGKL